MGYRDMVKGIISDCDIVLEIIDARFPEKSRNLDMEQYIEKEKKELIIVINKSDLISKRNAERIKNILGGRTVFVSATKRKGVARLRIGIGKIAADRQVKIAVIGYPNTGKSSIINMLKGSRAARTSSTAGFTRGKQYVRVSGRMLLIDSPGVIPFNENDEMLMSLLNAKNPQHLKDLEGTGVEMAEYLLRTQPETLQKHYGIEKRDGEEFLEELARKRNKLLKGARPDINAAARIFIDDFQQGKIAFSPEMPSQKKDKIPKNGQN